MGPIAKPQKAGLRAQTGIWVSWQPGPVLAGVAVAAGASYLAYRAYHSQSLASTQAMLLRAADTLQTLGAAADQGGAALQLISADLRSFLESDATQVPRSLRQLAKLGACPEIQDALQAAAGAAVRGAAPPATHAALAVLDRLLSAALSDRGSSVVALAVSAAARDGTAALVAALRGAVEGVQQQQPADTRVPSRPQLQLPSTAQSGSRALPWQLQPRTQQPETRQQSPIARPAAAAGAAAAAAVPSSPLADATSAALLGALSLLQSPPGERLMRTVISSSVGSAVEACIDQAATHDVYAPLISAIARPDCRVALTELTAAASGACWREVVAALCAYPPGATGPVLAGPWGQPLRAAQRRLELGGDVPEGVQIGELVEVEVEAAAAPAGDDAAAGNDGTAAAASAGTGSSSSLGSLSAAAAAAAAGEVGEEGVASRPGSPQTGPTTPEPPGLSGGSAPLRRPFARHAARRSSLASSNAAGASLPPLPPSAVAAAAAAGAEETAPAAATEAAVVMAGAPLGLTAWFVAFFSEAFKDPAIRSLMLEMSAASTRECMSALLPPAWPGGGWLRPLSAPQRAAGQARGGRGGAPVLQMSPEAALRVHVHRLQVLVSVALVLVLFALGPHGVLPAIAA